MYIFKFYCIIEEDLGSVIIMTKILKTELGATQKITVERMQFLYIEVPNDIASQRKAWSEFEALFPSLAGRKMYGLDYDGNKTYRICSLILDSDKRETYGLKQFEFEGGIYVRLRLKYGYPEIYEKIGPAYEFLISQYEKEINWELPLIEQYKARNVLDIMVPIK